MTKAARQSADAKAQAALDILNALDPVAPRAEQLAALKNALADRHFLVVARAAVLSGERLLHELIPDLVECLLAVFDGRGQARSALQGQERHRARPGDA